MYKKNSATVLVVNDDPSILCLIEELLSANKYQTILASSDKKVRNFLNQHELCYEKN